MTLSEYSAATRRELYEQTLATCQYKTKAFCQLVLPQYFTRPFSYNHDKLFELLEDQVIKYKGVVAHRGMGKSTILNFAYPLQKITFKLRRHLVDIGGSSTTAIARTEDIKNELLVNEVIRELIGEVKTDHFSAASWETANGVKVIPRGCGQQVRGLLYRGRRPDFIIYDDIEELEVAASDELTAKLKRWFHSDPMNCIDRGSDNFEQIFVGTSLGKKTLLEELRESPDWTFVDLPLCDENRKSCWVDFMTDEGVEKLYQGFKAHGMTTVFYREFCNKAVGEENKLFKEEHFRYYEESEVDFSSPWFFTAVITDPGKTSTESADPSAIVVFSLDTRTNNLYVRKCSNERITTLDLYEALRLDMKLFGATVIGVEVNSLNEYITKPIADYFLSKGHLFHLVELKAKGAKTTGLTMGFNGKPGRIVGLLPYYAAGKVYHKKGSCEVLEDQLLDFPVAKHDDVSDALSYFIQLCTACGLYSNLEVPMEKYNDPNYSPVDEFLTSLGPVTVKTGFSW